MAATLPSNNGGAQFVVELGAHDPGNQPGALNRARVAPRRLAGRQFAAVLCLAVAAALVAGCSRTNQPSLDAPTASADEKRDAALTDAIRAGMQRGSIPGAIV